MLSKPRIDFYVLSEARTTNRARLACQVAEKAYNSGYSVYIFTSSDEQAAALDDLLWSFRQDSFVPHERYPRVSVETSPVLLGTAPPAAVSAQVLINYTNTLPDAWENYERLIEVVDTDVQVLTASRQRFRHYRNSGFSPEIHKL